jgi:hypothetical protein
MTDQLSEELQYSQALVQPLLTCLQALSKGVSEQAANADALRLLLSNVRLVASIFYSLNSPGLTEVCAGTESDSAGGVRRAAVGRHVFGLLACRTHDGNLGASHACIVQLNNT